jgi:hypothetical protein
LKRSSGMGRMIVEFCSVAISPMVWKSLFP